MNKTQWRLSADDLKTASILFEFSIDGDGVGDVVTVPLGGLSPATVVRLSRCSPDDLYSVLLDSDTELYSPISMGTLMTKDYESIDWDEEDDHLSDVMMGTLKRVSLSIMRGKHGVYSIDMPLPDAPTLKALFGEK